MIGHTHYDVMGVAVHATPAELRAAFRRCAMRWHPDRNRDADAHAAFVALTAAYRVLADPALRSTYDRSLGLDRRMPARRPGPPRHVGFRDWIEARARHDRPGVERLAAHAPAARRARPFVRTLHVSLAEQITGCRRTLDVAWIESCPSCAGSGAGVAAPSSCAVCAGTGRTFASGVSEPCLPCASTGLLPPPRCVGCGGTGRVARRQQVEIVIPAGLAAGSTMPLADLRQDGGRNPAEMHVRIEFDDPSPI